MSSDGGDNLIKVVLVGETGVGKTSIISQFVDQIFEEELSSSVGGSFVSKNLVFNNGKIAKLQIWDTAGQERYRALSKLFYTNAIIAILVYDITSQITFDELKEYWINQIKESATDDIILAIVGNKADLIEKEEVDEVEARKFAKDNNAVFFRTSAKSSMGINKLFEDMTKKYYGWDENINLIELHDGDTEKASDSNSDVNSSKEKSITLIKEKSNESEQKKGCC